MAQDYTARPLPSWQDRWVQPVLFETPRSLTGTYLDDGRGILAWINGGSVRVGFVDTVRDLVEEGACESATSLGITQYGALACSVFRVAADLFLYLDDGDRANGRNVIYKADSTSNPTSWSLHGTLVDDSGGTDLFAPETHIAAVPRVSGSRWLLVAIDHWFAFTGHRDRHSVWRSTDGGVTWSRRASHSTGGGNDFPGTQHPHIGQDPATGNLYWSGESGSGGGTWNWDESQDDGLNWSTIESSTSGDANMGVWDDGADMVGLRRSDTVNAGDPVEIIRFHDPAGDVNDVTVLWTGPDYFGGLSDAHRRSRLVCDLGSAGLALFLWNRALPIRGGWQVGSAGFS